MMNVDELAEEFGAIGLLTERQAQAYLLRDVVELGRKETAAQMAIAPSSLDKHLSVARDKVESARDTIALLDELDQGSS